MSMRNPTLLIVLSLPLMLLAACDLPTTLITAIPAQGTPTQATAPSPTPGASRQELPLGIWGGQDVALIHDQDRAHLHWGCVVGDISRPLILAAGGAFEWYGTYNPDAYPVDQGTAYPARYTGRVEAGTMTITVTGTRNGTVFGPFTATLGQAPAMRECPICAPMHD